MNKKLSFLIIFGLLTLSLPLGAAEPPPQPQVDLGVKPTSGTRMDLIEVTATVESIDYAQRRVTLKGPEGNTVTFKVSEEVKKLNKVKKGDLVVAKYYESINWEILGKKAKNKSKTTITETKTVTEEGKKPSVTETKEVDLIATVSAKDKTVPSVSLKGPEGNIKTFKVSDPDRLDLVKIGDKVKLVYMEAMAISVQKAKK